MPVLTRVGGVLVQLVAIPRLIEGASAGRGGARLLLGVLRGADAIHHDLGARCTGARVWGPSARFDGQQVGRPHTLLDGDTVEILD